MRGGRNDDQTDSYSRREALAALAKYSAVLGGAAVTIVSAESLVSAASAYPPDEVLAEFCKKHPWHKKCKGVIFSIREIEF